MMNIVECGIRIALMVYNFFDKKFISLPMEQLKMKTFQTKNQQKKYTNQLSKNSGEEKCTIRQQITFGVPNFMIFNQ